MAGTAVSGKADFDDVYNSADPRAYYETLGSLGYVIPQHGADVFSRLLRARPSNGQTQPPRIVDICCSYGVGAALLKTDLSLDDLYTHYHHVNAHNLGGDGLLQADREFFDRHRRPDAPHVVGLDVAENAIGYAVAAGLLDDGIAANLESPEETPPDLSALLAGTTMIATTGGVGYVTELTFGRLLEHMDKPPWVASFCLREYDYGPIAGLLADRGLHTERSLRTFRQRRFQDEAEQRWAMSEVRARGLDTAGKESDGHYHAELFLSRPRADVERAPLEKLLDLPPAA